MARSYGHIQRTKMSGSQIKKDIYDNDKSSGMVYNTINEHKQKYFEVILQLLC